MKSLPENRILVGAIGISVLAHAVLLAVHFGAPDAFKFKPTDPSLEVILVNAKHDTKPVKAEALAQVNLDGGGNADAGRAKSPLPDMHLSEDGDSLNTTKRRIVELEQQQQKMLAQMQRKTAFSVSEPTPQDKQVDRTQQDDGTDNLADAKALRRKEAEIAKSIEDYNKRPKKTQITPSTSARGYAMYYRAFADKVERMGTLNFPKKDGNALHGKLVVSVPIYQDGSLYQKDGGVRVEISSKVPGLDAEAVRIIERAAPFGRFPQNMRSTGKDDVWEVIMTMTFSHEGQLTTELRAVDN